MAIWGIGAYFKGTVKKDRTDEFINNGYAAIGWGAKAPDLNNMFSSIKAGDIIYIKSRRIREKELIIKAIGIVKDYEKSEDKLTKEKRLNVKWLKNIESFDVNLDEKNNVYNNTLYEEFNPKIIEKIISKIV